MAGSRSLWRCCSMPAQTLQSVARWGPLPQTLPPVVQTGPLSSASRDLQAGTALLQASQGGHKEVFDMLMQRKQRADLDATDEVHPLVSFRLSGAHASHAISSLPLCPSVRP